MTSKCLSPRPFGSRNYAKKIRTSLLEEGTTVVVYKKNKIVYIMTLTISNITIGLLIKM